MRQPTAIVNADRRVDHLFFKLSDRHCLEMYIYIYIFCVIAYRALKTVVCGSTLLGHCDHGHPEQKSDMHESLDTEYQSCSGIWNTDLMAI